MKLRIITATLSALLAVSLFAGCTDKNTNDPAVSGTADVTTEATTNAITDNAHNDAETELQIKHKYLVSQDHAVILAEENTAKPIIYAGFTCRYFPTPAKVDGLSLASVTPLYSHSALHNYIEQNADKYDLEYGGEDSFALAAEKYMDTFFIDKGILIISFNDSDGGSDYTLKGGWEEHIHLEQMELDQLILALKKSAGEHTSGHLIVEMDSEFISLWNSISVSIYE